MREEIEKDYDNRGVANLIKLYLDDATACDYHLVEQNNGSANTSNVDKDKSHLGSAAFGCNCIAYCGKTIPTVRGQTNGDNSTSLYEFNIESEGFWTRAYNDYEKYDRLIFQRVCGPFSGIPCEECYNRTRKLVEYAGIHCVKCPKGESSGKQHSIEVKTQLDCADDYCGDKMDYLTKGVTCIVCGNKVRSAYKFVLYCRQCNHGKKSVEELNVLCSMCAIMCGDEKMFELSDITVPSGFMDVAKQYMNRYEMLRGYSKTASPQQPPAYNP